MATQLGRRKAVLRVGDGRGFVVRVGRQAKLILTAAHCLPFLPPPHPGSYLQERTFQALLGPLDVEPTVWAECVFVDPVSDIAVLVAPDNQELSEQAEAYEQLIASPRPLRIADAPIQQRHHVEGRNLDLRTPGRATVRVLSLTGEWIEFQATRRGSGLALEPSDRIVGGMSGSPIILDGRAIGLISMSQCCPTLADNLPRRVLRSGFTTIEADAIQRLAKIATTF